MLNAERAGGVSQLRQCTSCQVCRTPAVPGNASRLHVVGQRYVVRPHVVLPLAKADHTAQDVAGMDADAHADVDSGGVPDLSVGGAHGRGVDSQGALGHFGRF